MGWEEGLVGFEIERPTHRFSSLITLIKQSPPTRYSPTPPIASSCCSSTTQSLPYNLCKVAAAVKPPRPEPTITQSIFFGEEWRFKTGRGGGKRWKGEVEGRRARRRRMYETFMVRGMFLDESFLRIFVPSLSNSSFKNQPQKKSQPVT